jgi:hypothetical protein
MRKVEDPAAQEDEAPPAARKPCKVAACARLTRLTCLKDLIIANDWGINLAAGDVLALTALTGLTRLHFWYAMHGVDTAAATTLARQLTQLEDMCLYKCGLQLGSDEGMACLKAIRRLTRLTHLDLSDNNGLTPQGLMQLTGLSRLQELDCMDCYEPAANDITKEHVDAFWAAVRGQRQQ